MKRRKPINQFCFKYPWTNLFLLKLTFFAPKTLFSIKSDRSCPISKSIKTSELLDQMLISLSSNWSVAQLSKWISSFFYWKLFCDFKTKESQSLKFLPLARFQQNLRENSFLALMRPGSEVWRRWYELKFQTTCQSSLQSFLAWFQLLFPLYVWSRRSKKEKLLLRAVVSVDTILNFSFLFSTTVSRTKPHKMAIKFPRASRFYNNWPTKGQSLLPFWLRLKIKQVVSYTYKVQFIVEPLCIAWF